MSKYLDKVSKLLTQAENASTPEEAATFMAKVQELATANDIDLTVARMHQAKKERVQVPEERSIQVNPYNRRSNRKHFAELGMAVCAVNDIQFLVSGGEYKLFCVGFPSDLDVAEALFTHLSVQMVTECDAALKAGANKGTKRVRKTRRVEIPEDEREWGEWSEDGNHRYADSEDDVYSWRPAPPKYRTERVFELDADGVAQPVYEVKEVSLTDGRVYRHEFYANFVARMTGRLWEAKRKAQKAAGVEVAGSNERSLAMRDKKEEVAKADEERRAKVKHIGVYKGSGDTERGIDYTGLAREHGRKAAERVPVGDDAREVG